MGFITYVLKDLLIMLYQHTAVSLIFAVLIMFVMRYAKRHGIKEIIKDWADNFKKDRNFRLKLLFAFYFFIILSRTVTGRSIWCNPVENVLGVWTIYTETGDINTELFENLFMLMPYTFLLFAAAPEILERKSVGKSIGILNILIKSAAVSFGLSITIELCQLFLKLGTFQLSDIFFNTLGGLIGGVTYWIIIKIRRKKYGADTANIRIRREL